MFINARPRPDLNGFRSFVPSRIVELSYHWPNSMTNHGTSAWGNLRPVTSFAATPGAWPYRSDAASNAENYSDALAQAFFSEPSQASPSYAHAPLGNQSIPAASKRIENSQAQPTDMIQLEAQSSYDLQELQSPHLESAMPFLGANANNHGWIMDRSATNSSRFPRAQYASNDLSYIDQPSLEIDDIASMSSSAGGPSLFSLYNDSPAIDSFESSDIKPSTVYPSPFGQAIVPSFSIAISSRAAAVQDSFNGGRPWQEIARNSSLVNPCNMSSSFNHDGLPRVPSALWSTQSELPLNWPQHAAPPGTISPQALSLIAPSSSPIAVDNSPRSSSGWLSETSLTSQAFQESAGDIPYPAVQSVTSGRSQAQGPHGDMPHSSIRLAQAKAIQIPSPGGEMADSTFRPAKSQGFGTVQATDGKAHPSIQPLMSQELERQRSMGDRQSLTMLSVISEADDVDSSTRDLSRRVIGAVPSQGFRSQKSAGAVQHSAGRVLRPRRKLPAARVSNVYVQPLSSNVAVPSRSRKGLVMVRSRTPGTNSDDTQSSPSSARQHSKKSSSMQRPLGSEKCETKTRERQVLGIMIEAKPASTISGTEDTAQQRIAKDKFLLDSKRIGKSYKQIRLEGGFIEAESTLRGRHRTLTKKPEERVRKPEWESNDLRLLKTAVHKLAGDPSSLRPKKISWKEVSDYIVNNGGSYRFGNSTCRKKWSELYDNSSDQDLS